jgi:hypothetical protein
MDFKEENRRLQKELNQLVIKKTKQLNNSTTPNWFTKFVDKLFYARRIGRDKAEWIFTLTRFFMFLLIILSLIYAFLMFTYDVNKIATYSNTKDYSEHIVQSLKLNIEKSIEIDSTLAKENLKIKDKQIKFLLKTIESESEEIIKIKSSKKDLETLKIIEHIFVYILPFLVLLGLYYYFESNFKTKLINSGISDIEDIEQSKSNLNTTKTLFISSMMSYTVIKIIEKLFIEKASNLDTKYLIAYGIFLLLLMTYLILSHNHDKPKEEKEKH